MFVISLLKTMQKITRFFKKNVSINFILIFVDISNNAIDPTKNILIIKCLLTYFKVLYYAHFLNFTIKKIINIQILIFV